MNAPKQDRGNFWWLAEEDLAATRRVLSILGQAGSAGAPRRGSQAKPLASHPEAALERAQLVLALRQRRVEVLGRRFTSEPMFLLLLAIYVLEERDTSLIISRIVRVAMLKMTTALRWLDLLAKDGWVERTDMGSDRRMVKVSLTPKGGAAMDQLFSWSDEE